MNQINKPFLRPKKDQKCWGCKKELFSPTMKGKRTDFCWNGHYWHLKCKEKDSQKRIAIYLKKV
jgi:hypothetical protein